MGAYKNAGGGHQRGAVYVYENLGGVWTEIQKLTASDGKNEDFFGQSISLDENYIVVGSHKNSEQGLWSGSAYVFENQGGTWVETQKLLSSDGIVGDRFGKSVSTVAGSYILVGAHREDAKGGDSGSAYVFENQGGTWVEIAKLFATDGTLYDHFGFRVAISKTHSLIGAPEHDSKEELDSGVAYIFNHEKLAPQAALIVEESRSEPLFEAPLFSIYPNPSKGKVSLDLHPQPSFVHLAVYDSYADLIWEANGELGVLSRHLNQILPTWKNGQYFIKIQTEDRFYTQRLLLEK